MEAETSGSPPVTIPNPGQLGPIWRTYERGLTIDALQLAEVLGPLSSWRGVEACVLAARIAANTGAARLATKLSLRAWRTDPGHPDGQAQYAYEVISRRGAFALWQRTRNWPANSRANPEQQAEWLSLKAWIAFDLRDFSLAEKLITEAEAIDPGRAWIRLQRARLLEAQDRVEEALEVCREACALHPHPFYRVGVQTQAHLLQALDQDDEAIALLQAAERGLQNGPLVAQLYSLHSENGYWAEAEAALERYVTLSPLMEAPVEKWVKSQRARVAYHQGNRAEAARRAVLLDDEFHKSFAQRLEAPPETPERVQLDVTFVRQHFKTCAPATLAALGRFWKMPADHLRLAEAMCYDGTPGWQQRDWAVQNGWVVREFRVTHETAIALIERGLPFAISTVEATSAHMMAVIGFDRTRGTLLLRDPGQPYVLEFCATEFLKRNRAFGPAGMVFVPSQARDRLEGLDLPDAPAYDEMHEIMLGLSQHDRARAAAALERMQAAAPDAVLTCEARLLLASYDANANEQLRSLDRLLEHFPGNASRVLQRLERMTSATREERIQWLQPLCHEKEADPALLIALAGACQGDARVHAEAIRRLRRAMRFRPMDTSAIRTLADLRWDEGRLEEATEIYRVAADLEGFREPLYKSWFVACYQTRRTPEAIAYLEDRFNRFGGKSEQPALTLAWALIERDEPRRARQVLEKAMELRPVDGYLRLRAAGLLSQLGEFALAESRLEEARERVRHNDWLRVKAEIAENRLDYQGVLEYSREVLEREPLALDAHARVARSLLRREGMPAAVAALRQASAAFPYHYGLQRMVVEWSREEGPQEVANAARELLAREPSDAWARRELALTLLRLGQGDAALREALEAARIEPRNSYCFSVLGHVRQDQGQPAEARQAFLQAVALSVDNDEAVQALLNLAHTDAERLEDLNTIERELIRQVVTGDGLLAYLDIARPLLPGETLLEQLRLAHRVRPDMWHAWAALVDQLSHLKRFDEALDLATSATVRFSHLPRTWLDLAMVHRWRNEPKEEIAAAQRAFEINPSWNRGAIALASAFERQNDLNAARGVYERALRHAPQDARLHAAHANLLWRLQQNGECFAAVEQALRLAPAFDWAWGLLLDWAAHLDQPERAKNFARALATERPGDLTVWLCLARVLTKPEECEERLAAVETALALNRRHAEAWDIKAEYLAEAERFDEAIQACLDGAQVCVAEVYMLRGRHAWIEAKRKRLPEAIRLMQSVLAENGSYIWGWHQLGMWLIQQEDLPEATRVFERLQQLRPHEAWVNRQLGFLLLKQKDTAGARRAFAAALAAAPTDVVAAHNLFNAQLDAGDLADAETTLHVMQTHQPGAESQAAELRLRLHQGELNSALKCFEGIIHSPEPDPWAVNTATEALQRRGLASKALKALRREVRAGSGNPQNGVAVVKLLQSNGSGFSAIRFFLSLPEGEAQRRAASPLIQWLAEKRHPLLFRWVLWRRRDMLHRHDDSWGQVGFAFSTLKRMKAAVPWLADWERRPNVQPWMLFNYCLALRHAEKWEEATRVARHVVEKWGHRDGAADLHLFIAIEEAMRGEIAAAEDHLNRALVREGNHYDQLMMALARSLVDLHKLPADQRRKEFPAIRRRLEPKLPKTFSGAEPDVRRTFQRTGRVFYRSGAGQRARWWFKMRLWGF